MPFSCLLQVRYYQTSKEATKVLSIFSPGTLSKYKPSVPDYKTTGSWNEEATFWHNNSAFKNPLCLDRNWSSFCTVLKSVATWYMWILFQVCMRIYSTNGTEYLSTAVPDHKRTRTRNEDEMLSNWKKETTDYGTISKHYFHFILHSGHGPRHTTLHIPMHTCTPPHTHTH